MCKLNKNRIVFLGALLFSFLSCTSIANKKAFRDLEKIEKRKEIKTNGYYWVKDYFEFDGAQCLDLDVYVFFSDFNVKGVIGTGKYCGKVDQLSEDSIISMEHNRIQNLLTGGPNSDFYKDLLYWGKYRTTKGKLSIAIISDVIFGFGLRYFTSVWEGEVLSESVIKIDDLVYKFKEFDFNVYYDMIPLNKYD